MGRNASHALEEAKKFGLVINLAKTVGNLKSTGKIKVESKEIEECQEFCYLGSTITNDGGCDRRFWYDWVKPTVHLDS